MTSCNEQVAAFLAADGAWSAELVRIFGHEAGQAAYEKRGRDHRHVGAHGAAMTPTEFTTARKSLSMTQADLAAAFCVTRETISRIERGETIPAVYVLAMAGLTILTAVGWNWRDGVHTVDPLRAAINPLQSRT